MGSYSPYSVNEAEPPKWRPGEDIAAGGFVGMTLFLFLEVNLMIFRAFKKRRGLYFWSMQIGTLGVLMATVGTILKAFCLPSVSAIWPLHTLFILIGWAVYCTAQSLVLYSRLHLVMRNPRIQRYVLYMIVSTIFIFIIPHYVFVWPSYNALDREMSSLWSPREAIAQRYTQMGYTITESIISGLYIWSLVGLLRLKSNVRQRRVMSDLIYVNIVVIALDFLEVGFVYTNQIGISQPVQNFSYILKLRLEFLVLNQLMDVAARGMRRETFGKNRYYHRTNGKDEPAYDNAPIHGAESSPPIGQKDLSKTPGPTTLASSIPLSNSLSPPKSTYQIRRTNRSGSDVQNSGPESETESTSMDYIGIEERQSFSIDRKPLTQKGRDGAGFVDKTPPTFADFTRPSTWPSKNSKFLSFRQRLRSHRGNSDDDEDDEDGIELQLWERRGTAVVELPWFRTKVEV